MINDTTGATMTEHEELEALYEQRVGDDRASYDVAVGELVDALDEALDALIMSDAEYHRPLARKINNLLAKYRKDETMNDAKEAR